MNNTQDAAAKPSVGRVVSVTGSRVFAHLDTNAENGGPDQNNRPEMGTLLRVDASNAMVFALVTALRVESYQAASTVAETWVAELDLVGELLVDENGEMTTFRRGVTAYPNLGDEIFLATQKELRKTFANHNEATVEIGKLTQDPSIPAVIKVDELLGKHFAILGTTGTGKSCTVALLLRSILWDNPLAHVLLIDPHNEYSSSFGQAAEVVSPENLYLPYWFLTFQEISEVFLGDRPDSLAEQEILADVIPAAKARYAQGQQRGRGGPQKSARSRLHDGPTYTVDSPVPYRISDVLDLILDRMGRLEHKNSLGPYKLLKSRIEAVSKDPRFAFMFGSVTVTDDMASILSRMFRVPVNNKPITILELTGLPSEVINVVVSVICRMSFDFALWSNGLVPLTIVCEEAHRYIPKDASSGFEPTRRAISRIAKEGRKYGVSLGIVTQRPTELDPTIVSQCNTVFAMRMSNELDQAMVRAAIPDAAESVLEFLPSLGTGEAIAFGDGVTLPARLRFNMLPEHAMPHSTTAKFSEKWSKNITDPKFMEAIIKRWRAAGHPDGDIESEPAPAHPAMSAPAVANTMSPPPHAPRHPMSAAAGQMGQPAAQASFAPQEQSAPLGQPGPLGQAARPPMPQQAPARPAPNGLGARPEGNEPAPAAPQNNLNRRF